MKSAQSMTVSRHVQSVRSVHRRRNPPQERLRNWQVRQHDTATRRASSALHSHLPSPPSLVSTRSLILPRDASSSPTPLRPSTFPREGDRESPRSRPSPKTNITLHLVTACNVRDLRSAWNFIFDGLRFADERKTEPSVHLPSSSIPYYPRICGFFSAIFSSFFFFFSRNFCEDYLILKDSMGNLAFFVSLWLKDNSKNSKFYIMLDYTNFNWSLINRITGASIFTPTFS